MTDKPKLTQQDIAAKSRRELVDLMDKTADAMLNDDPNVSLDDVLRTNNLIDRELARRTDAGDIH